MKARKRWLVGVAVALAAVVPGSASALPRIKANPANKMLARGIDPIRYDRATRCNGGRVMAGTLAMVGWLARNASGVNWGEYRCEMWGKHEASIHSVGRAIDWHPSTTAAGHALVSLLLAPDNEGNVAALARRMGIQGLIYDCQAWFGSSDGQLGQYSYCYSQNGRRRNNLDPTQAHMNHVHIELNKLGAAMKTTFWDKSVRYPVDQQDTVQEEQGLDERDGHHEWAAAGGVRVDLTP